MTASQPVVGLDIGSTATKAVVLAADRTVLGSSVLSSGGYFEERAERALEEALEGAKVPARDVSFIMATGYGRLRAPMACGTLTELSCHARGAYHLVPRKTTVVDIGGQDNKIISVEEGGRRGRTKMNRKCAAGTGAFIESAARQLGVDPAELQALAASCQQPVEIGSFCTVFAASEIIEQLRKGCSKEGIARGVIRAVALRVFEMERFSTEVVLTGGVAQHFPLIAEELEQLSGFTVTIPPQPQMAGALGAALYALEAIEAGAASCTGADDEESWAPKARMSATDKAV
jgi:predicted CoA-substrate-specific enzyme activase